MSDNIAPQRPTFVVGERNNPAVSFDGVLASGELLTGTPTVAEETTTDLTISSESVNTVALTINGESVAIGRAVQFSVVGQQAGVTYMLKITATTDSVPAQVKIRHVVFEAEAA